MVREVMPANAIACSVDHTVAQARELMAANLIKHLPVLDGRERVVLKLEEPFQVTWTVLEP